MRTYLKIRLGMAEAIFASGGGETAVGGIRREKHLNIAPNRDEIGPKGQNDIFTL